ncbi:phage tail sheath C-terminal domain-containing protein [Winogradskyella sp.]|uniref:phage tail sheath family protein n=1 Tax=Winogradskyella sp. TaxID=1883156 RepID=UPI0025D31FFA|nr:phage tail sheath C-terminal domain-containing protein [Winogradskyella sp.]
MSVTTMKTPGVYIQELDAFGNAIVPVPTAIPAFIGYTDNISYNGKNLVNQPVRVDSFAEFRSIFGSHPPQVQFEVINISDVPENAVKPDKDFSANGIDFAITNATVNYRLFSAIRFFYENGGGSCYIVSTGSYDYTLQSLNSTTPFENALTVLEKEAEPTIIVIPDAVELINTLGTDLKTKYALSYKLQSEMINHCGKLANRVAILDIPGGYNEPIVGETSVEGFRNNVEPKLAKFNSYAVAYYPWLNTSVNQLSDVSYLNISEKSYDTVITMLNKEFPEVINSNDDSLSDNPIKPNIEALFNVNNTVEESIKDNADSVLKNLSKSYKIMLDHLLEKINLIPPSSAMAGIYNSVDNNEGVWVAPANVGIQGVISPSIKIDTRAQEDLNVPLDGKSICAIRSFTGRGVLVWGARTLDGNSNDWRYINVRRTLIYIEQSIKEAARAYVFAPNDSSTWVSVKSMISNFLVGLWNQGGLVGPKPTDAFSVSVGLGSTMTPEDIHEGKMNVSVKVAVSHPAEFIEINFQQEMQKA